MAKCISIKYYCILVEYVFMTMYVDNLIHIQKNYTFRHNMYQKIRTENRT